MFGDFDGDGVKNIDDPKPFDKGVSKWPDIVKDKKFYHKAQYGGGEIRLSDALTSVENSNNKQAPILMKFLNNNKGSEGRIKTVPSTINKLNSKFGEQLSDIAGAEVITKNRREAIRRAEEIARNNKHDKSRTDNFYNKPKGDVYYAYHLGLVDDDKRQLEVQVKSKPMKLLHLQMHEDYKKGIPLSSFKKRSKRLFDLGF